MPRETTRDAGSQTEKLATTSANAISPLMDSGLFRESNYEFLKAPPSANSSMRSRKNSRSVQQETQSRTALGPRMDNQIALDSEATGLDSDRSEATIKTMPPPKSTIALSSTHMDPSGAPLVSPSTNEWSDSVFAVPALPAPSMARGDMSTPVSRQTSRASMHRDDASLGGPTGSTSKYYSSARSGPSQGSIRQSRDNVKQRADVVVPATPASRSTTQQRMASMSSARSSEYGLPPPPTESRQQGFSASGSTDPAVVQDLTKTMIGQFLWKDTRKAFGSGLSGNMHERFFWINPYTKTLYWSAVDPGGVHAAESSAKSGKSTR
jgi:hypothetical protein